MPVKVGDIWYRIEERVYASVNEWDELVSKRLVLNEIRLKVCKVTPKGVRLVHPFEYEAGYVPKHARFVSETSRKKYAHPSLESAYEGFLARKQAQARILTRQLSRVAEAKQKALAVMARMKEETPVEVGTA